MDDTTNWEFAAAVAAVCIGLGGLLLFTLIGAIGSWRVFDRAREAAIESAKANVAVQDLARSVAARDAALAPQTSPASLEESRALSDLRRQADALIDQQARLQDAVRNLVDSAAQRSEESTSRLRDIEGSIKRLEQHLSQIAAAVANLAVQR